MLKRFAFNINFMNITKREYWTFEAIATRIVFSLVINHLAVLAARRQSTSLLYQPTSCLEDMSIVVKEYAPSFSH